jgi:hypothetical protein
MHISKIKFGIKMPIMQFANEVIEVTIDVMQGEDANEAIETARKLCLENHKAANPHLFADQETKISDIANAIEDKKQRPKSQVEGLIFDLQSVTELTVLKSYELLCRNNPKLQKAYQLKLKELTNG